MKTFSLIGAAGYVAPRHMAAIKETGNELVAALDSHDCVGVLDRFFPSCSFFTEFERFDRHLERLRTENGKCDYLSICSPNHLHDSHVRFGLRSGLDVICEKPIFVTPWQVDWLLEANSKFENTVNTIFQLRLHPSIVELKSKIEKIDKKFDVELTYVTPRGKWYDVSWKGDEQKSGGIACNIGIHFFDMLSWIFGPKHLNIVHAYEHDMACGYLELVKARVKWFLSINRNHLPNPEEFKPFRSITIDGEEIQFSDGFTDLHTRSYEQILQGNGFGIEDAKESIFTTYEISNSKPIGLKGDYHPFMRKRI